MRPGMKSHGERKVRYAVVGLGYISQVAMLPAFAHATENSELGALVSDDPVKLRALGRKYRVKRLYSYDQYEDCLSSGEVDAVYIGLPNHLHREYAIRAARAGVHVLCEKPLAVTQQECERMIRAAEENNVKLMTAYRLHFEEANLKAAEIVQSGRLGNPRIFSSVFSMRVVEGNIRLEAEKGGGTLWDIGIYCVNAARYLFRAEPFEVIAATASRNEERFAEVEEMTSAILRFPEDRLASFTCSFGAADVSSYRVVGTEGDLVVEPAYDYSEVLGHRLTIGGRSRERRFPKRDQFAAELIYFSRCILTGKDPEPSGTEGLIDVQIIQALYRSAENGKPVRLDAWTRKRRPTLDQEIRRPATQKPSGLIHVESPSGD